MISKQHLNELFDYKNGVLYWKSPKSNRLKIGQKAGTVAKDKRERINVCGKLLLTHRIIFAMHHDYWPKYVDHIDCDKSNNKIENLRETTVHQNQWNKHLDCRNTSGIKGVSFDKRRNKWVAEIRNHNKKIFLGRFNSVAEAEKTVKIARTQIHGEFARHF
jgi:hypothetical protein